LIVPRAGSQFSAMRCSLRYSSARSRIAATTPDASRSGGHFVDVAPNRRSAEAGMAFRLDYSLRARTIVYSLSLLRTDFEGTMVAYRLYCLDSAGQISLADWINAADDQDAIRQAREVERGASKCEIWQGSRLVATLDAQDLAADRASSEPPLDAYGSTSNST